MKTPLKLFFLPVFFALTISCVHDYHGGNGQDIEFTETNYVYEGHLYQIHLKAEIKALDIEIKELEDILANGQGDNNTQQELAKAYEQRDFLNKELQGIIDLEQVGLKLPKPKPPCPNPQNCDFSDLKYVLTDSKVQQIYLQFYNAQDQLVGGGNIDDLMSLAGSKGQLHYSHLGMAPNTGVVAKIKVFVKTSDKNERSYVVN
ncbi:MAG: hypothetical protein AB3N16_00550 [Flavobacteriaceae bacterium]